MSNNAKLDDNRMIHRFKAIVKNRKTLEGDNATPILYRYNIIKPQKTEF